MVATKAPTDKRTAAQLVSYASDFFAQIRVTEVFEFYACDRCD